MATLHGSGPAFTISTEPPLDQVALRFNRFADDIKDWKEPLTACGKLFQRQMGEQFETEGAATKRPWRQNDKEYRDWKASHGFGTKIGVLHGYLRSSLTGGSGYSEHVTGDSAWYGMSDSSPARKYGAYFSGKEYLGSTGPVIHVTPEWGNQYAKLIHMWMVDKLRSDLHLGAGGVGEYTRLGGRL